MDGIGIDLGTANTVVCHTRRGIVLNEPSIMLLRTDGRRRSRLLGVGADAKALLGRTPAGVAAIRPVQDGVVTDLETARTYLRAALRRAALPAVRQRTVRAVIGVPAGATSLERRALLEAAQESHLPRTTLLAEPMAGAIGAGIDPRERRTHLVVDVGGGTSEVTAFSYGGIVAHRSCRVAGDEMTFAVYRQLRLEYGLAVGELVAEDVKITAAHEETPSFIVQGQDLASGRPRMLTLSVDEVVEVVRPVTEAILSTLAACLEDLTPQAVTDINEEGILAFGGGSLMRGFDKAMESAFGFSVRLAERPLTCVAEGAAACVSDPALLKLFAVS
ncbi:MAG: rod shape-determining protein MreB [Actinomycetes bacterium]